MKNTELFQLALGLAPPWNVVSREFNLEKKRLDIELDFPRGSTFPCSECGRSDCKAYNNEEKKTCRQPNFFQYEAYLSVRVPGFDVRTWF